MSEPHKTSNDKLVSALRILAGEIESPDGVANVTIGEGADRIEELAAANSMAKTWEESFAKTVPALRARVAELEAEIERWRTATAKLRDGADESARVATEQLARAEQRLAGHGVEVAGAGPSSAPAFPDLLPAGEHQQLRAARVLNL